MDSSPLLFTDHYPLKKGGGGVNTPSSWVYNLVMAGGIGKGLLLYLTNPTITEICYSIVIGHPTTNRSASQIDQDTITITVEDVQLSSRYVEPGCLAKEANIPRFLLHDTLG